MKIRYTINNRIFKIGDRVRVMTINHSMGMNHGHFKLHKEFTIVKIDKTEIPEVGQC